MKLYIFSFLISLLLGLVFMPMMREMLLASSLLEKNYRGDMIPNAMGLGIIFAQVLSLGLLSFFCQFPTSTRNIYHYSMVYLIGFVFIGLLGLLDDTIGTDEYKGFKGHIGAFFRGELTTGNIKALLGAFIGLYVSFYISDNIVEILINTITIALFTNLMNLFDLRPGRAIKLFLLVSVFNLLVSKTKIEAYIIVSLYGILASYIGYDLRAMAMMGDTGSNVLGYSLGYYVANNFPPSWKLIIIFILIFINLLSEKKSFSKIIENNRVLNFIDQLGR